MKAVVFSGVGGLRVFFRAVTALTTPGPAGPGERLVGFRFLPEFVDGVVRLEGPVGVLELGEQFPERFRDVGAALHLALDDQAQGRALHAADGEEVGAEAAGRERDRAGQRRPPEQVDVLARGAGVGQRVAQVVEVVEGAQKFLFGRRRVARPEDFQRPRGGVLTACRAPGWRRASPPGPRARSARPRGRSRSRSPARRPLCAIFLIALTTFLSVASLIRSASIRSWRSVFCQFE